MLLDGFHGVFPVVDAGVIERFAGVWIRDFEGPEEPAAADISNHVMVVFEGAELVFEVWCVVFDVLEEAVFVFVDGGEAGGARDGVAGEGLADAYAVVAEVVGDFGLHEDAGEGGV